jgi:formate hydrogenlyase subunit 3/multisubunit Na+/H+ antiporter MnhD subunit
MSTEAAAHLWVLLGLLAVLMACAVAAAALHRRSLAFVYPICLLVAGVACLVDASALLTGTEASATLPLGLPAIGVRFRLDALSAYFGLIINIGIVAAALYGLGLHVRSELSGRVEPFFPVFSAAMNLVLLADDAFSFLFSWELMSLASWALVLSRHEDAESRKAGHLYLVMALIGTCALLFTFGGLAGAAGNYAFGTIRDHQLGSLASGLVLFAALIGAGSKAGLMPLHAWLPLAHPVAPSHVSALMSGVMTKVAIYAILRIVFDLMGEPHWWWSVPFIVLGAITAVGGLLYAILDEQLKRVLAFSTVENIGIIFVGIGLALAFKTTNLHQAAAVAMAGALLHAMNHSWFKSLLFLGAGAVLHATGRKDFDGLGGLIHRMPQTTFYFLVGALAISALPPLNGFVSEWLLFQSVLAGPQLPEPLLRFLSPAVGALLALAAGLAAACFVRVFGIVFLGRARSTEAAGAHEVAPIQRGAMAFLATLCICGGLFGSVMVAVIAPLLVQLIGLELPGTGAGPTIFSLVPFGPVRSIYDAPIIALFVALSASLITLFIHWVSNRRVRRAPAWDCGFPDASPITQYSASSFSQPLRRVYGRLAFAATETVEMPEPGDPRPAVLHVRLTDYVWQWLYAAPAAAVRSAGSSLNFLQFLTVRRYLVLMFTALIALLLINIVRL